MRNPFSSAFRPVTALVLLLLLTGRAPAATLYVNVNNPTPASPFTNWTSAAQVIQDAVDAAQPGDTVLVTNGVYATGGRAVYSTMTNRVAVDRAVILRSVNGPSVTFIQGYKVAGGDLGLGEEAIRCVYLTNGATLIGFTITNGATKPFDGTVPAISAGGGVCCESELATIANCTFVSNSAGSGGGVYLGTLSNCLLNGNTATDFGAGATEAILNHCNLVGNMCYWLGGGVNGGILQSCTLSLNSANFGGGAGAATLINCTVVGNAATMAAGVESCVLTNCIVYYNRVVSYPTIDYGTFYHCCITPMPDSGSGNITNEPILVDRESGNFHLQSNSPCINAGTNASAPGPTDLDGNPRIVNGTVDIGAYEWQVPARFAPLARPGPGGLALSLSGETGRVYAVHASSNLATWFWLGQFTNTPGPSQFTDPLVPLPPARFYKAVPVP